jgi:hypothetical protein
MAHKWKQSQAAARGANARPAPPATLGEKSKQHTGLPEERDEAASSGDEEQGMKVSSRRGHLYD